MTFLKATAAASALLLTASAATASTILIDDFDLFQEVVDVPVDVGDENSNTVGPDASILGGFRTLTVATNPAGNEGSELRSTGLGSGFNPPSALVFSNDATQSGTAIVIYGEDAGGSALGDLTMGGVLDKFFFEVLSADLDGTTLVTEVKDTGTGVSSVTEVLDATFSPFTAFSAFTGDADFTSVGSLTFTFDTGDIKDFDGALGSISVVPLPLSALLLLGGLGGLAGVSVASKRRRKSATA